MASSSAGTGTTTPSAGAFWKSGRRGFAGASTRAPASRSSRSRTRTSPESATAGAWGTVYGELLTFDDPDTRIARHSARAVPTSTSGYCYMPR